MITLLDWQKPLLQRLLDMQPRRKLIALPTGTGKTYIAGAYAAAKQKKPLVLCPKAVIPAWKTVLPKYYDVLNPERLKTGKTPWWSADKRWRLYEDTLVIIDEIHQGASGPKSKYTGILAQLKAYPVEILILSATPAASPLQMRALGYLTDQHGFVLRDYYRWCRAHGCFDHPQFGGLHFPKGAAGQTYMNRIHQQMQDRLLYCSLDDIPGFPETFLQVELLDLGSKQTTAEINNIYKEYESLAAEAKNALTEILRLRQAVEVLKVPALVEVVRNQLEEEQVSIVVFSSFRQTLHLLREALQQYQPAIIIGEQSATERQNNIDRFQANQTALCLATLGAGGVGISLHDVHHARPRRSYICPGYSASEFKQALGRIHRAGGTKTIQSIVLAAGTIEERVYRAVNQKLSNISTLLDGDLDPLMGPEGSI
jgi:superfamily II DNA or RNA helicase